MALTELQSKSPEEINRLVAERVMGWEVKLIRENFNPDSPVHMQCKTPDGINENFEPYADDNDMRLVREEIERRGLRLAMSKKLWVLVCSEWIEKEPMEGLSGWLMLDASCRDQCIAALLSIEEPT